MMRALTGEERTQIMNKFVRRRKKKGCNRYWYRGRIGETEERNFNPLSL